MNNHEQLLALEAAQQDAYRERLLEVRESPSVSVTLDGSVITFRPFYAESIPEIEAIMAREDWWRDVMFTDAGIAFVRFNDGESRQIFFDREVC